jgi:hypothetical protein
VADEMGPYVLVELEGRSTGAEPSSSTTPTPTASSCPTTARRRTRSCRGATLSASAIGVVPTCPDLGEWRGTASRQLTRFGNRRTSSTACTLDRRQSSCLALFVLLPTHGFDGGLVSAKS